MKILLGVLLLTGGLAYGQEVVYKDQVTVYWDAVTPTGGSMEYELFLAAHPVVAPQDPSAHASLVVTDQLEWTVDVDWNTTKAIGVRAVMTMPDASQKYSDINWSDVNGEGTPNPFLLVSVQSPAMPLGLGTKD